MSLYVLADLHLSLALNKPMDIFGGRWKNYVEKIETLWKKHITDDDTVVIPGDISWGMTIDEALPDLLFIENLPGKKIISKGNHDYFWQTAKKMNDFFEKNNIKTVSLLHNNAYIVDNFVICGSRGWFNETLSPAECDYQKLVARESGRLERSILYGKNLLEGKNEEEFEILVFLHFPPVYGGFVCREIVDVLHKYNIKRVYYGHLHGAYNLPSVTNFEGIDLFLISSDFLQFRPFLIEKR